MAKIMKGLGRGLDALLGGDEDGPAPVEQSLSVGRLRPGRYQPRSRMDPDSIAELAESIKAQGVIQPILVRPIAGNNYEIIAGERRWRAAQLAGLTEVPVTIRTVDDKAALALALIENIQREDLNPLEEAIGIQRLISEFQMTHDTAAGAVGRSRSAVTNLLRLLNLQKAVQEFLMQGRLEMGHARALLAVEGPRQLELAQRVIAQGLSVRETEALTGEHRAPERAAPRKGRKDRDVVSLEEELSDLLGTTVVISPARNGRGRITLNYSNLDQFEDFVGRLKAGQGAD